MKEGESKNTALILIKNQFDRTLRHFVSKFLDTILTKLRKRACAEEDDELMEGSIAAGGLNAVS